MNIYLDAIRENVCSICVDSSETGKCLLTKKELCAVEKYLPGIVDVVHSLKSDNIGEYVNLLKSKICFYCRLQDKSGNCVLREEVNCSLDRYFPYIVEIIKRVDKKNNHLFK
jgi:hypothetical protein